MSIHIPADVITFIFHWWNFQFVSFELLHLAISHHVLRCTSPQIASGSTIDHTYRLNYQKECNDVPISRVWSMDQ